MTDLLVHFFLFTLAGIGMLLVPLVIGRLVRPSLPTEEKDSIYECGEPTIGTSYIQFDLRFYVVALLFIIFDVEVAFFFPWALVYGNAMQLADSQLVDAASREALAGKLLNAQAATEVTIGPETAHWLGVTGLVDILVFFGVLLVGFAYVWKRGDLDWVRAVGERETTAVDPAASEPEPQPVG